MRLQLSCESASMFFLVAVVAHAVKSELIGEHINEVRFFLAHVFFSESIVVYIISEKSVKINMKAEKTPPKSQSKILSVIFPFLSL